MPWRSWGNWDPRGRHNSRSTPGSDGRFGTSWKTTLGITIVWLWSQLPWGHSPNVTCSRASKLSTWMFPLTASDETSSVSLTTSPPLPSGQATRTLGSTTLDAQRRPAVRGQEMVCKALIFNIFQICHCSVF